MSDHPKIHEKPASLQGEQGRCNHAGQSGQVRQRGPGYKVACLPERHSAHQHPAFMTHGKKRQYLPAP
ncbi:hypothetical protein LH425_09565 [Laribacter hongkongensis]|uniref:hypothetical protein n=1 Tax=Laribacter hongkongensis TaxID=168471 RepID=UPI001EFD55C2|nr:hypothetical protein [Laribacter hongkongensis]MCG9065283.1 hypothetical protein [Laribacter hongkongensis]